jgi:hypothetical protein
VVRDLVDDGPADLACDLRLGAADGADRLAVDGDARAPFLMMQVVAGTLADGRRVVNISSAVTSTALAGIALYSGATDTAAVVAFLASEDAGFTTGQVIYAAGGQRGPISFGR